MEEPSVLSGIGILCDIWVTDQSPILVGSGCGADGIPYRILAYSLLNNTVEHVPQPAQTGATRNGVMMVTVEVEFYVDLLNNVRSVQEAK